MSDAIRTVTVERLAQSGEGSARVDGRHVRIPGTLPGEHVRVEVHGTVGRLVEVLQASPRRVQALCPVADTCGGCAWQHIAPDDQQEARLSSLRRALPPALREVSIEKVPSPRSYGWRGRARLGWQSIRGGTSLGFRGHGSTQIVDAPGCPVLLPILSDALAPLRSHLAAIAPAGEVTLAVGRDGKPVASIRPEGHTAQGFDVVDGLMGEGFAGVALWAPGATLPSRAGDPRPRLTGADGDELLVGIEGFSQANTALNASLARYVVAQTPCAGRTVAELHAGAGNFTVLAAQTARKVTAVESDPMAVEALQHNLAARGFSNVSVRCEDAEVAIKTLKADVLLLDPPRTGARTVVEALPAVRGVVYVSCDPATLGRDLGILAERYDLTSLAMFEMFPQTPHVEVVATLTARRGRSGGRGPRPGATSRTG